MDWLCLPPWSMWVAVPLERSSEDGTSYSYRARFLENLAASQKEKLFAISKGRAEVLAEASPSPEPVAAGNA